MTALFSLWRLRVISNSRSILFNRNEIILLVVSFVCLYIVECPPDFIDTDDGCYLVVNSNLPWSSAALRCQSRKAHLVVIGNEDEQRTVADIIMEHLDSKTMSQHSYVRIYIPPCLLRGLYTLLMFLLFLFKLILMRPTISECTGSIFTKFSALADVRVEWRWSIWYSFSDQWCFQRESLLYDQSSW